MSDYIERLEDQEREAQLYGYCDYCERIGHTFHTCPKRDDESEVDC